MAVLRQRRKRLEFSRRAKATPRQSPRLCRLGFERLEDRRLLALIAPSLNSAPGAADILFLDFDGAPAFNWNNRDADGMLNVKAVHGPGATDVPVPAFTIDADATDFSDDERLEIEKIWRAVVGKMGIFNVNVTTVDPGHRTDGAVVHVLIGGSNSDWYGPGGGIASIGAYNEADEDNTCFVWTGAGVAGGTMSDTTRSFIYETAVHEAGHVYGLSHQRQWDGGTPITLLVAEYYGGDATRVPIMGAGNQNATIDNDLRSIWWQTNFEPGQQSSDAIRNDLADLDNAGLDYAADDYSSSANIFLAHTPSTGDVNQDGIINSVSDVDGFRFVADGPTVQFRMSSENAGRMMAPSITLVSYPSLDLVSATVVQGRLSATLTATNLVPGQTYAIQVNSRGIDAFDIGGYDITGTVGRFARVDPATGNVEVFGYSNVDNNIRIKVEPTGALVITNTVGGGTAEFRHAAFETPRIRVTLGGGNDIVTFEKIGPVPIEVDGGTGNNTLRLQGATTTNNFTVTENILGGRAVWAAGSPSGNIVTSISFQRTNLEVYAGSNSMDVLSVTPAAIAYTPAPIRFIGDGGVDVLEIAASAVATAQQWYFNDGYVSLPDPDRISGFAYIDFDANVERVSLLTGAGDDTVTVRSTVTTGITANGNGGNDSFIVGGGNVGTANLASTLAGGAGNDSLVLDDSLYAGAANWAITDTNIQRNIPGLAQVLQLRGVRGRRHQDRHRRQRQREQHHHVRRHPRQRHRHRRRRRRQLLHQQLCQRSGRRTGRARAAPIHVRRRRRVQPAHRRRFGAGNSHVQHVPDAARNQRGAGG